MHEFVEFIPDRLEQGKLYISIQYTTASHLCCCGCGAEVVTPFAPTDWTLSFDGETVSLAPSIGNWSFPCRSHYWIQQNAVRWAGRWSEEQIRAGRARDAQRKSRRFKSTESEADSEPSVAPVPINQRYKKLTLLQRIKNWLGLSSD